MGATLLFFQKGLEESTCSPNSTYLSPPIFSPPLFSNPVCIPFTSIVLHSSLAVALVLGSLGL